MHFTTEQHLLLGLAAHSWQDVQLSTLASHAAEVLTDIDGASDLPLTLGLAQGQRGINDLFQAIVDQVGVQFDYRARGQQSSSARTVDPWHLALNGDHWYLVGFDHERGEQRTFKFARFTSSVTVLEQSITHPKPEHFDINAVVASWVLGDDEQKTANIKVSPGQAGLLRIQAHNIITHADGDELVIAYSNEELLARDLAVVVDQVHSIAPASLHNAVADGIRATLQRHQS